MNNKVQEHSQKKRQKRKEELEKKIQEMKEQHARMKEYMLSDVCYCLSKCIEQHAPLHEFINSFLDTANACTDTI
jgi:hypothetical protein